MMAIHEVLGTVLESCWISHAEGLIWDSVRQGWWDNCDVLGNCLYKECTTLVHQKVKEKKICIGAVCISFTEVWFITTVGFS